MYSALADALAINEKDMAEMKSCHNDAFVALGSQAESWIEKHPGDMWTYEKGQVIIAQLGEATKPNKDKYYTACLVFKKGFEVYQKDVQVVTPLAEELSTVASGEPPNHAELPLEKPMEQVVPKTEEEQSDTTPGQLWAPSLAGGAIVPAQDDIHESWKQFEAWKQMRHVAPTEVNYEKCLARVWGNGAGGQCRHAP